MNIARCHEYNFNSWFESETLNIMEAWKQRSDVFVLKKKTCSSIQFNTIGKISLQKWKRVNKLQSLYKLINHHAIIKRLFHHQTGNLRQLKKTNYETIKDHDLQNEYQFRRPSISVVMYTFTTKKYSAREMRVCLLGILSSQCICF